MPANVTITYGLPGSGKTFYSRRVDNEWTSIIHMDDHIVDGKYESIYEILKNMRKNKLRTNNIYIDCLITTNKKLKEIIKEVYNFYQNECKCRREFKIVWWEGNREACKKNAERRNDGRNVSVSIDRLPYEEVDEVAIRRFMMNLDSLTKINFERRRVYMDCNWDVYFQPLIDNCYESEGKYYFSDSWSRGGSWGDCWGNHGNIHPDEQPSSFEQFDKLLEDICPNITFIQYKRVFNECVTIDEYSESDYYGGTEYKARYKLDLRKCYDMLRERNLIEE